MPFYSPPHPPLLHEQVEGKDTVNYRMKALYNPLDFISKNAAGGLSGGGKEICGQVEIRGILCLKEGTP